MSSELSNALLPLDYEVRVYKRRARFDGDIDVITFPYQADIFVNREPRQDHHGVGVSPELALLRASQHWMSHAQKV